MAAAILILALASSFFTSFLSLRSLSRLSFAPWKRRLQLNPELYKCANTYTRDVALSLYRMDKLGYSDPNGQWDYFLLEKADVDEAAEIALKVFYEPKLRLDLHGMTSAEAAFWTGLMSFINRWDMAEVRMGNYWGFRSRAGLRLTSPQLGIMKGESVLLGAAPHNNIDPTTNSTSSLSTDLGTASDKVRIVGIVELCLETADGQLTPCFRYPWSGRSLTDDEPYLCNLCVCPAYRRRGLGGSLATLCEEIARREWGKNRILLHVETKNDAAQGLYLSLGYRPEPRPAMASWDKRLEGILYYSKELRMSMKAKANSSITPPADTMPFHPSSLIPNYDFKSVPDSIPVSGPNPWGTGTEPSARRALKTR